VAWKRYDTKPLEELLRDWSGRLGRLEVVMRSGVRGRITTPHCIEDAEQEEIRGIYKDCGWRSGTCGCRKEECGGRLLEW
jgi:hypothetical protein